MSRVDAASSVAAVTSSSAAPSVRSSPSVRLPARAAGVRRGAERVTPPDVAELELDIDDGRPLEIVRFFTAAQVEALAQISGLPLVTVAAWSAGNTIGKEPHDRLVATAVALFGAPQ